MMGKASGNKPAVAIFGSNDPEPGSAEYETARAAGRRMAGLGYVVINGGYGGTMAASSRGAKEAGGSTVGVVCSIWSSQANEFTDRKIITATANERLQTLLAEGNAGYIVLPGATGTLAELATAWEMLAKKLTTPRPLVCVGEHWRAVIDTITAAKPRAGKYVTTIAAPADLPKIFDAIV